MKRKVTVILSTIAVLFVVGIILVLGIAGYFYHSFSKANDTARVQGEEYGRSTDQKGCVDESVRHFGAFKENNIFIRVEQMHISKFTRGCLKTSKPTEDFCRDAPQPSKYKLPLEWELKKCGDANLDINGPCHSIFTAVIDKCDTAKKEAVRHQN